VNDIAFASPEIVFLVGGGNVYRSDDGGRTWAERFSIYRGVQTVAVSPVFAADQTLFVADGASRLFRSTDGGATWEEITRIAQIGGASDAELWLSISPAFPDDPTLWATSFGQAYRSTDGGLTWKPFDPGVPIEGFVRLVPNPNYPADPALEVESPLELDPSLPLPQSLDGPLTFAASDTTLLLGTMYGLHRSTDGGETWAEANTGLARTYVGLPVVLADGTIYGVVRGLQVVRLPVGGTSWERLGTLPTNEAGTVSIAGLDVAGAPPSLVVTAYYGMFISSDEGVTWERMESEGVPPSSFSHPLPLLSPDFAESGVAHLAYSGRVYRTDDSGDTWTRVEDVTGAGPLIEAPDGRLITFGRGAVYEWDPESGTEWVRHSVHPGFGNDPADVRFCTNQFAVAVMDDDVYLSKDGGRGWTRIGQGELDWSFEHLISPRFDADRAIYGVGEQALYVSTDAGGTWVEAGEGLPFCEYYGGPECDLIFLGAVRTDDGYNIYAAVRDDFHTRIWVARATTDL
jgi:photosystem II stability/assembly factor-like uncharacterized protein